MPELIPITAEIVASKFQVTRQQADEYALKSQRKWVQAQKKGNFKDEIIPITLNVKGKEVMFTIDEHPKPDSTIEILSKLPTRFKKDGIVTAGNATAHVDGAAAVVLASQRAVNKNKLTPLARIVGYSVVGVPHEILGKLICYFKMFN